MYADDIILLAENELDLQVLLNELHNWCSKWRMAINADKTQVIHFRNRKVPKTTMSFHVGNEELKIVNSYRYLGATVNEVMEIDVTGNVLADGASRALGKLLSTYYRNKGLGIRTYTKLYESCIIPIMDYCSGVWGFTGNKKLDKIHMRAMRCYLGVNRYSAKVGIEGELGWVNPQIRRWLNMLRLWNRIVGMNNTRLPKIIYEYQRSLDSKGNWCSEIKEIFSRILCNDVYENNVPIANVKVFLNYAKEKLISEYVVRWKTELDNKPKLCLLQQYKTEFAIETYCKLNLKRSQRSLIAKLRLGILPIHIETGRYNRIERGLRVCLVCNNGRVEDEFHVMFYCQAHKEARDILIYKAHKAEPRYHTYNDIHKLQFLTCNRNIIRKTANFISKMLHCRQLILRR